MILSHQSNLQYQSHEEVVCNLSPATKVAIRAVSPFQFEYLERYDIIQDSDISLIDYLEIDFKDIVEKRQKMYEKMEGRAIPRIEKRLLKLIPTIDVELY